MKGKFNFAFIVGETEVENEQVKVKDLEKREAQTFDLKNFSQRNFLEHYKLSKRT